MYHIVEHQINYPIEAEELDEVKIHHHHEEEHTKLCFFYHRELEEEHTVRIFIDDITIDGEVFLSNKFDEGTVKCEVNFYGINALKIYLQEQSLRIKQFAVDFNLPINEAGLLWTDLFAEDFANSTLGDVIWDIDLI